MNKITLEQLIAEQYSCKDKTELLKKFIVVNPHSYFSLIKKPKFKPLHDFVMYETQWMLANTAIQSRCTYTILGLHDYIHCHNPNCCKELHRTIQPIAALKTLAKSGELMLWCNPKCQAEDPYLGQKISVAAKETRAKKSTFHKDLPHECHIIYKDAPIIYDDEMNQQLKEYYEKHPKSFEYWIEKEPILKKYLYEKSYPLDYTNLSLGTRLYWVFNKMQRIPKCSTCGRQLDFYNLKPSSKNWLQFCSNECREADSKNLIGQKNRYKNSYDLYEKILDSEIIPLFDVDELNQFKDDPMHLFKCRCKKCQSEFFAKLDVNFYWRFNQTYFRCVNCYPHLNHRKSQLELEVLDFVKSVVPNTLVLSGSRKIIYPYELDIYIPDLKIAIEFNGIFWHSLDNKNTSDYNGFSYHYEKTITCEKLGIKLIHVWEDEWLNSRQLVEAMLKGIITDPTFHMRYYDSANIIKVDRAIFNKAFNFDGYELQEELGPEIIIRSRSSEKYKVANSGYLIYRKVNN